MQSTVSAPAAGMGLDDLIHALCNLDSQFRQKLTTVDSEFREDCPRSDVAICAMFLRDNLGQPVEETDPIVSRRVLPERVSISDETKKRFVRIMLRMSRAHEGVSREERAFLRQFWQELRHL